MKKMIVSCALATAVLLAGSGCARAQVPAPAAAPTAEVRGYTGINISFSMTAGPGGTEESHPVVSAIHPGSPAAKAGFANGDMILEVNGHDSREFGVMRVRPGERYTYRVRRGQEERELVLVAVPRPAALDRPRR